MVAACPFPWPRGTPVRIFRMAEALVERGHQVHVVTYHHGEQASAPMKIHRTRKISSYQKYSPGPTYRKLILLDPLLARRLVGVLKDYEIDVIHAHHYEGLLVGAFARFFTGHPLVYDAHTLLETELPSYGLGLPRGIKREIGKSLDYHLPQWSDHVVAVSERIRRKFLIQGRIDSGRVSTVSNGVEFERFAQCSWPDETGTPTRRIIFTGNLAAYQGVELMLEAFARVAQKRGDVRLVLVSRSSFEEHEGHARALGILPLIDLIPSEFDSLASELEQATIALNPRLECDGIPQKLLNYMAAGRAVVSFEGSATCVDHDKTGWVVPNGDPRRFADGILRLLDDPTLAQRIGAAARAFVKVHHTWNDTAASVERIYTDLLMEKSN